MTEEEAKDMRVKKAKDMLIRNIIDISRDFNRDPYNCPERYSDFRFHKGVLYALYKTEIITVDEYKKLNKTLVNAYDTFYFVD